MHIDIKRLNPFKIICYFLSFAFIALFFIALVQNRNYISVPNSDIFQYINDGRQYLKLKFPESIHPPPFAPIIICLGAKFLKGLVEYPEIVSVHSIIIILSTLSLLNIFLIIRKQSLPLATIAVFLMATNQTYGYSSLDVTNEIIYGYFLTLAILLYQRKPSWYVYLLFGFLFLIRYESIVAITAVFIIELIYNRQQFKFINLLIAIYPIVLWLIVLNFRSAGITLFDNAYILEIKNGIGKIPNFDAFRSLSNIIIFNTKKNFLIPNALLSVLFFLEIFVFKNRPINRIIYLTFFLHIVFLFFFPNFFPRYYLPVIWILYFFLINRHSVLIAFPLIFLLINYNFAQINTPYIYDNSEENSEYRMVANWINKKKFYKPTDLYIFDPGIVQYYIHNPKVKIRYNNPNDDQNDFKKCHSQITCIIKKKLNPISKKSRYPRNSLVVITKNSSTPIFCIQDQYTALSHHIMTFQSINFSNVNKHFQLVTILGDVDSWAKIYKYVQ